MKLSGVAWNLLEFWETNPRARDTLLAIARWWLARQQAQVITRKVKRALGELEKMGLVTRRELMGHDPTYELNQKEVPRVRTLLRKKRGDGGKSEHGSDQSN